MVSRIVEAVYEDGVLKPVKPLSLDEHENVRLGTLEDLETLHPYVASDPDVCGGRPIIRDTRIPVQTIVGYYKLRITVDEILAGLPHLTAAQVFDALSYSHNHQAEIEADIAAGEPEVLLARYRLRMEPGGRVIPAEWGVA
jgi:uncharacterized protein (DUF433 family)